MSVFQGDFLGFQLGNEHSYGLNITRVSTNDRYQDILLPNFTDATVQVPGGDGTYYWDTYYTQKPFQIDFAFDDLRDEDLRKLRQLFSFKGIQPLIFDEFPYKKYMVKCAQPPNLRYLCFDWLEFRIYKGEGTVNFIAYYPFAFSVISPSISYVSADVGSVINNNGDMPANLKVLYNISNFEGDIELTLKDESGAVIGYLQLTSVSAKDDDRYILVDTQTQLIEGLDENKNKTKNLYNRFITKGDFFWPPVGRSMLYSTQAFESATYTPLFY